MAGGAVQPRDEREGRDGLSRDEGCVRTPGVHLVVVLGGHRDCGVANCNGRGDERMYSDEAMIR